MRQNPCTQRTANPLDGRGKGVEQSWQSETRYPDQTFLVVERGGIRGGDASYPGKPSCSGAKEAAEGARKPSRRGDPEAVREQRVADPRVVLKTQGLRSLVTVWRTKP